jgi:hypothetical protein
VAKTVAELEVAAPAATGLLETIVMSTPSNCHGFLQKEPDSVACLLGGKGRGVRLPLGGIPQPEGANAVDRLFKKIDLTSAPHH